MCCACDGGEQVDANGDPIAESESEDEAASGGEGSDEESGEDEGSDEESSEDEESEDEESEDEESGSDESSSGESEDEESDDGAPSAASEGCPYIGYEENECGRREWCEAQCVIAGGRWEGPYQTDRQTTKESCTTWDENDQETLCDYRKMSYDGSDNGCD